MLRFGRPDRPAHRRARRGWLPALAAGVLSASACGSAGSKSARRASAAADAAVSTASVRAIYRPGPAPMQFGDIPWPDDGYLDANGKVAVRGIPSQASSDYAAALASAYSDLDGFGLRPTVYFGFDGALDPKSLPTNADATLDRNASVFLLDADTSSPEAFMRVAADVTYDAASHEVRLRPAAYRTLAPGRRYAAVVTRGVNAADGTAIDGGDRFLRVRDPESVLADPRERAARTLYTPVLETLAMQGVARDRVAALAVFNVQTARADLSDAHDIVHKLDVAGPRLAKAIGGAALDQALGSPPVGAVGLDQGGPHEHIGFMIQGSFSSPSFLGSTPGVHGAWKRGPQAELLVQGTEEVPLTLFVPRGTAAASAYPVVVVQHGLGGDRSDALPIANALAASGYAVVAIDAPFHGSRAGAADEKNAFTGEASPDGFGDAPGDFVGQSDEDGPLTPLHPFYYRDAVRQAVVDLFALVQLLQAGDWSGLGALDPALDGVTLNTTRLSFVGIDLGGELGVMLATFENSVTALVPAFSSGLTLDSWARSPGAKPLVDALLQRLGRDPGQVDWGGDAPLYWPDFDAWRTLVDRGSAASQAPSTRRLPLNLLMFMAQEDEQVDNYGTESLASSLGAELVGGTPLLNLPTRTIAPGAAASGNFAAEAGAVTRILYLLDPATHSTLLRERGMQLYAHPLMAPFMLLPKPTAVDNPIAPTLTQIAFLLQSLRTCAASATNASIICAASVQAPAGQ